MTDTKNNQDIKKQQEDFSATLGGGLILLAAGYGLYKILTKNSQIEDKQSSNASNNSELLYRLIREGLL